VSKAIMAAVWASPNAAIFSDVMRVVSGPGRMAAASKAGEAQTDYLLRLQGGLPRPQ
jgi:hypothetical protein